MKILIVDDTQKKAGNIKKVCIDECEIDENDIEMASDNEAAIKKLHQTKYQLMIMDMYLPEKYGDTLQKDGGIKLLRELDNNMTILPDHVVVLTAYENIANEYKNVVNQFSFQCIVYDDDSIEWRDAVVSKIRYIKKCENSQKEKRQYDYDVAIVTAVPKENKAVKNLDKSWIKVTCDDDTANYYETKWVSVIGKEIRVVTTMLPQMGMVAAATITSKLIYHFTPHYIIMPGIAGGVKTEYNYGDIVIPDEVKDYCSGKYSTPKGMKEEDISNPFDYFEPTSLSLHTDIDILNLIQEDYSEELIKIHQDWNDNDEYVLPQIRTGNMATGDSVIQNNMVVKKLINDKIRKADGIDMEAYGVYFAAAQSITPRPIPICMKSISDFADKEKMDKHQNYAAYTSASFMKYFITEKLFAK